jgi:hypothetical protein
MNRVSGIFQRSLGIQLRLVDVEKLIPTQPAFADPFDDSGFGIHAALTRYLDTKIGNENYDVGHVFTTRSGGAAGLGTHPHTSDLLCDAFCLMSFYLMSAHAYTRLCAQTHARISHF